MMWRAWICLLPLSSGLRMFGGNDTDGSNETLDRREKGWMRRSYVPKLTEVSRPDIDWDELHGKVPTFIDAFLSPTGSVAYVVLSTKLIKNLGWRAGKNGAPLREYNKFIGADWKCAWAGGPTLSPVGAPKRDSSCISLVIECPTPGGTAGANLHLTLTGQMGGQSLYNRDILVRKDDTLDRSKTALCSMAVWTARVRPFIKEWLYYHSSVGFDQIVLYVEDRELAWWLEFLKDFPAAGKVRLVHFYFGKFSDKRKWIMQQAQETHCVWLAKGRVSWMGHSDPDEYYQRMDEGLDLKPYLDDLPANVGAVSVRSQFWFWDARRSRGRDERAPCDMTCKDPGYFPTNQRPKLLMRTSSVNYVHVHFVTGLESSHRVYTADPEHEVRINHFKAISTPFKRWFPNGKKCKADLRFQDVCQKLARPT